MVVELAAKQILDVQTIRWDFPILSRTIHGWPLVYLDNAATSQKPVQVIQALTDFYTTHNANIHRGVHGLAQEATEAYENARAKVARFIGAAAPEQCVFTRNTTESINLVAYAWGCKHVGPGDEVLVTQLEHHSNLVPWQLLTQEKGGTVRYIPLSPDGTLDLSDIHSLLTERTKILAVAHMSNVLGTINPVAGLARMAHEVGALCLVDGAQSVPHLPVDVQELDCDFLAFSAHKMLGPTGVGVLYARPALLESMPPFLGGGSMIREVTWEGSTWNDVPWKFEAGTPNIADVAAFGAAIDYLESLRMEHVRAHERELTAYALEAVASIPGVRLYGPLNPDERGGVVTFNVDGVHPHDVATILDSEGIAIRAGHHCARPLHQWLDVPATVRASFYVYNTPEEVDALVRGISRVKEVFRRVRRHLVA